MRRKAGFAPWTSSMGQDRLSDGFVVTKGHLQYLFMVVHDNDYVGISTIEDKLRACQNLNLDDWRLIGIVREIVKPWISKNHPLIVREFIEVKCRDKNYCLFEKVL